MGEIFGTDGVRGVANEEITGKLTYRIGRNAGYFLEKAGKELEEDRPDDFRGKIFVGRDTRVSADMLESALAAGLTSVGLDVVQLGIIPTPGLAWLTAQKDVWGGVMISASHNPVADNGIKFFDSQGFKLSEEKEEQIEQYIKTKEKKLPFPTHDDIGRIFSRETLKQEYIDFLVNIIDGDLSDYKIVLDCAHGAACPVAPPVFEELGAELVLMNSEVDGMKINVECGSTAPEKVQNKVESTGADLGIAHDGDADRVILIDHKGQIVDGDKIMALLALDMIDRGELKHNTLVTTRYSNLGLKEVLEERGGKIKLVKNGDKYVLAEMNKNDYNLGGEKSGHIINLDYNTTGDGILTALLVLAVMNRKQVSLHELADCMEEWPQRMSNVEVTEKEEWQENNMIQKKIQQASKDLGDRGRVFVRASGTEPVIRIMLEGKEPEKLEYWENELETVIARELN